jgi:hypothetical protein
VLGTRRGSCRAAQGPSNPNSLDVEVPAPGAELAEAQLTVPRTRTRWTRRSPQRAPSRWPRPSRAPWSAPGSKRSRAGAALVRDLSDWLAERGRPRITALNRKLADAMQNLSDAGHSEIFDTDVRDRLYEALEEPIEDAGLNPDDLDVIYTASDTAASDEPRRSRLHDADRQPPAASDRAVVYGHSSTASARGCAFDSPATGARRAWGSMLHVKLGWDVVNAGSLRVAKRVWPAWRRRAAEDQEWELQLLLAPKGEVAEAERAVRESVLEMQAAFQAAAERSAEPDPPWPGEWSFARTVSGVLVKVTECDAFDEVLPAVVDGIVRRGVAGKLDLWRAPKGVLPPYRAAMLHCLVRVRGSREHRGERIYRWVPDSGAFGSVLASADQWCRRGVADATAFSLSISTAGCIAITLQEDVVSRIHDAAVSLRQHASVAAFSDRGFRCLQANPSGGISLVVGGPAVENRGWTTLVAELTEFLRAAAEHIAYAHVRRGWDVFLSVERLPADLRLAPPPQPRATRRGGARVAFEDLYAPDAFGAQLLGPGYADRLPTAPGWHTQNVADATALVQHVDPAAWFDAPFVPLGQLAQQNLPQPAVLTQARRDLAAILYSPGVLADARFADMKDP